MAVETEQNTFLTPPEGGDNSPASVAVCEENLEALLRAVTSPGEPPPPVAAPVRAESPVAINTIVAADASVVADAPTVVAADASVVADAPTVPDPIVADDPVIAEPLAFVDPAIEIPPPPVSESLAQIATTAGAHENTETTIQVTAGGMATEAYPQPVHDAETQSQEVHPKEVLEETTHPEEASENSPNPAEQGAPAPVVESHQEVVSKLALLSSIKQRRAVAMRSDTGKSPVPEPEITGSSTGQDAASTLVEQPAPAAEKQPVPDAPPADKQAAKDKKAVQEDRPGAVAWRERAQPKASEPPKIEKKDPPGKENQRQSATSARDDRSSTPSLHRDPRSAPITRSGSALFPPEAEVSGNAKSFVTSGGLALIGGTVLALGLTAYLLLGHGSKPAASADKKTVKESVQTSRADATPSASPAKSSTEKSSSLPPPFAAPGTESKGQEKAPAKVDVVQSPKPAEVPSQTTTATTTATTPPPAVVNAARTVARTFAPPAAGTRPADTTISEAPPALSTTPTPSVPSLTTLPSGIAPPPPSAPKTTVTRQISVDAKVQATRLVRRVTPAYPPLARATRVQGAVRFRATIATDGQIKGLIPLSGPSPLVQGATDAVKQWRYQPTIANGEPVEVITEIDVVFTL